MQQHLNATKRPNWMHMAVRLAVFVALALLVPLILGIVLDYVTGRSPIFMLMGMVTGMLIALAIVLRTIQNRLIVLAPSADTEDAKENL